MALNTGSRSLNLENNKDCLIFIHCTSLANSIERAFAAPSARPTRPRKSLSRNTFSAAAVVPPGDVVALKQAMQCVMDDPAATDAMGTQASKRFDRLFHHEQTCKAYRTLYAQG